MCKVKKISVEEVGSQVPNAALKNVCLIMGLFGIRDLKEGFCIFFLSYKLGFSEESDLEVKPNKTEEHVLAAILSS